MMTVTSDWCFGLLGVGQRGRDKIKTIDNRQNRAGLSAVIPPSMGLLSMASVYLSKPEDDSDV